MERGASSERVRVCAKADGRVEGQAELAASECTVRF